MSRDVFVCGVGMIPFTKPGANEPYPQMGAYATRAALQDAGIGYEQVQQAYVGYVYGDSTSGQRALYEVGMTGIPVVNVNNNCSWRARRWPAARPTACWRWVSSR